MIKKLTTALLLLLVWSSIAFAQIGTPLNLGTASNVGCNTTGAVITTGATAPAGATIFVAMGDPSQINAASFLPTDSAGNTYRLLATVKIAGAGADTTALYAASNITSLPSGGTITYITSTSGAGCAISAASVTGLGGAVVDVSNTSTTNGTHVTVSATTTVANDILIGVRTDDQVPETVSTQATGFTALTAINTVASVNWAYDIISSTGSQSYGPTFSAAHNSTELLIAVEQASASAGTRPLIGVGQ